MFLNEFIITRNCKCFIVCLKQEFNNCNYVKNFHAKCQIDKVRSNLFKLSMLLFYNFSIQYTKR